MKIKIYNNQYVKRILSGLTGMVLLMSANSTAKAVSNTIEMTKPNGEKITISVPENATGVKINPDGSVEYTLGNNSDIVVNEAEQVTTVNPNAFVPTEEELNYADYQKLCDDQMNEIKAHLADIERIQVEYYKNKNFILNEEKLFEYVKAFVYVTNHQLFDEETKALILANDIDTDIAVLIGNDYTSFTNFVDGYNQLIIREQEIEGNFDKSKLISCEYSFGNATDRGEYVFARDTWFESVVNGRVWNDEYYTLYGYISNLSGVGLGTHYIDNASLGARASIRSTVGVDFKESHKVVFDEYMKNKENKKKFTTYFEDIVTYKLREGAKADILAGMEEANQANNEISTARENGDFTGVPTELCEDNLDTLVYYYAHICDDVDDFGYVVSSLNNEFNGKTK